MYNCTIKHNSCVLKRHVKSIMEGFCENLDVKHGSHIYGRVFTQLRRNLMKKVAQTEVNDQNIDVRLQQIWCKPVRGTNKKLHRLKYVLTQDRKDTIEIYSSTENLTPKIIMWCIEKRVQNLTKPTPSEKVAKEKLKSITGVMSITQMPFYILGGIYFADFFLPEYNIIIEIDGGYHNSPTQIKKDQKRDVFLSGAGIKVVRITNEDAENTMQLYQTVYDALKESNKLNKKAKPLQLIQTHIDNQDEFGPRVIQPKIPKELKVVNDDVIAGNVAKLRLSQIEWIYNKREEFLKETTQPQHTLYRMLEEEGLSPRLKCPIIADNLLYFVDIFIPEYNLAVDVQNLERKYNREYAAIKSSDLKDSEIASISILEKEVSNPRILKILKAKRFKAKMAEEE